MDYKNEVVKTVPLPVVCSMDGDKYLVRIPAERSYNKLIKLTEHPELAKDGPVTGLKGLYQGIVRRKDASGIYVYDLRAPHDTLLKYTFSDHRLEYSSTRLILFRLMLEPLDERGYISHDLEENPDGSGVEGGSLYRNTSELTVDAESGLQVMGVESVEDFCTKTEAESSICCFGENLDFFLGDTSEHAKPIEWVFSGGRLISRECIGLAPIEYLWEHGYIYSSKSFVP